MFCLIKYTLQEPVLGTNTNRYHHQPYAGPWLAYEHSSASLFGLVIALQFLVSMETGQIAHSPLIFVGSTLAIAALFQPLRNQIQAIIDRRFYRRKYDAARTLESFNKTLRDEMDIEELRERLVAVVQETMQPAFVTLWLLQTERQEKALDDGFKDH